MIYIKIRNGIYIYSGYVNLDNFTEVLTVMGESLTREEVLDFFQIVDKDNNNKIDFNEFVTFMMDSVPNVGGIV